MCVTLNNNNMDGGVFDFAYETGRLKMSMMSLLLLLMMMLLTMAMASQIFFVGDDGSMNVAEEERQTVTLHYCLVNLNSALRHCSLRVCTMKQ